MKRTVGRPGKGRAKSGRVTGTIMPELRSRLEEIATNDGRFRSLSHLLESCVEFYLELYTKSNRRLDERNFPIIDIKPPEVVKDTPRKTHRG